MRNPANFVKPLCRLRSASAGHAGADGKAFHYDLFKSRRTRRKGVTPTTLSADGAATAMAAGKFDCLAGATAQQQKAAYRPIGQRY